ncbi:VOC family protein [Hoeflea prorocentri]|uniref:VOC family protein n=1 Tax=Hoeflea prorocentri TaxID=1922333 RepID=A0A9X3ZHW6_9HYPH|nr:VOC family protein [Hoeflea prorocentri]MCY6381256.1 VOC family protein [Hoeflea prorocentri]MDA5399056.1 VOC family protein [Hoeflea prorocentri]
MRFVNPLPFVADMDRSRRFYTQVLGLEIVEDHGDFVRFDNGFAIHEGASLLRSVFGRTSKPTEPFGRDNLVLYFEVEDLDATFADIGKKVDLIHPVQMQGWGQRVFRFHDPDRHIIEIGEPQ